MSMYFKGVFIKPILLEKFSDEEAVFNLLGIAKYSFVQETNYETVLGKYYFDDENTQEEKDLSIFSDKNIEEIKKFDYYTTSSSYSFSILKNKMVSWSMRTCTLELLIL